MPAFPAVVVTTEADGTLREHHVPAEALVAWMAAAGSVVTGLNRNPHQRAELRGQPTFSGFCGPMWHGDPDRPAIRYEDRRAYADLAT